MDRKLYSYEVPKCVVKARGGKYDLGQVRDVVVNVTTSPELGRKAALGSSIRWVAA